MEEKGAEMERVRNCGAGEGGDSEEEAGTGWRGEGRRGWQRLEKSTDERLMKAGASRDQHEAWRQKRLIDLEGLTSFHAASVVKQAWKRVFFLCETHRCINRMRKKIADKKFQTNPASLRIH